MRKLGIIALAVVLALGAMGIGYAMWYDTITISGTVQTGTVDLNVIDYSSTYVYKDLQTDAMVISPVPVSGLHYVASSVAEPNGEDAVKMTWDNIFPLDPTGQGFKCDVTLKNDGTIPVKLQVSYVPGSGEWILAPNVMTWAPADIEGVQLEPGDKINLALTIKIPDDNAFQNKNASGTAIIKAVQWNEYVPSVPPVP